MMKMPSTRSKQSSKLGSQENHGARIPQAFLAETPATTVKKARATADANCTIDETSIGTMMK
jgi:hypothetical protein